MVYNTGPKCLSDKCFLTKRRGAVSKKKRDFLDLFNKTFFSLNCGGISQSVCHFNPILIFEKGLIIGPKIKKLLRLSFTPICNKLECPWMIVSRARVYLRNEPSLCLNLGQAPGLTNNIRPDGKDLSQTNTLAYFKYL